MATPMKWTIRVELTPDGKPPITRDTATITRPIADLSQEQIGPTLEEVAQLLSSHLTRVRFNET
jgi:hypothetical protein